MALGSMAYTTTTLLLLSFLFLQPWSGKSDFNLAPVFSPIFDNVCKEVECGKGNCKPSRNSTFLFNCECEPGWKQARSDLNDGLGFLPCVIPNCTLDLSCAKSPAAPVQNKQKQTNESFLDPCRWAECGGGICNKTSPFTYACQCEENYYNLLNVTTLPCFRECALGTECSGLGISVWNKSSSSSQAPSLSDNVSNQACLMKGGVFNLLAFMVILLALVIVK